jgi:hypothetical protein
MKNAVRATLAAALVLATKHTLASAPLCNTETFYKTYCTTHQACVSPNNPAGSAWVSQQFFCGNASQAGDPEPINGTTWGCQIAPAECGDTLPTESACANKGQSQEVCGDSQDNNFDGCVDEGCTLNRGTTCECTAESL